MLNASEIYELIETRRRELGLSQAAIGLIAFGKEDNTAIQSIKKGSAPSVERMAAIAKALDLDFYLGPRRDPHAPPPAPIEIDAQEFATVLRVDAEASAGPGRLNGDAQVIGSLAFRRDWLRDHGVKPDNALLVTVTGDSMEPRITAGDLVLVDLSPTAIENGHLYLFNDADGETRIKRLHRLGARTVALVSDNPDHPPELRSGVDAERIKVLGQVIWSGHNWA